MKAAKLYFYLLITLIILFTYKYFTDSHITYKDEEYADGCGYLTYPF